MNLINQVLTNYNELIYTCLGIIIGSFVSIIINTFKEKRKISNEILKKSLNIYQVLYDKICLYYKEENCEKYFNKLISTYNDLIFSKETIFITKRIRIQIEQALVMKPESQKDDIKNKMSTITKCIKDDYSDILNELGYPKYTIKCLLIRIAFYTSLILLVISSFFIKYSIDFILENIFVFIITGVMAISIAIIILTLFLYRNYLG